MVYIYSSLWVGTFFLFLLGASNNSPVRLYFKEHEEDIRSSKKVTKWKEKIYLYPAILQRKWLDYKFKDRFISYTKFDNVLPLQLTYPTLNPTGTPIEITVRSSDKDYKQLKVRVLNQNGEAIIERAIDSVRVGKSIGVSLSVPTPGVYSIVLTVDGTDYRKSSILFYKEFEPEDKPLEALSNIKKEDVAKIELYCSRCKSRIFNMEASVDQEYIYKNYIPFKEYLDFDGLDSSFISDFIMQLPHSGEHKSGLVHLLNMLRLATVEDELTIVTNLFKEDPQFAYFITNRLFLFSMIPIMADRELQKILSVVDDEIIARSLFGESGLLVKKVLGNVSKRRARFIKDAVGCTQKNGSDAVKEEMHRIIKSYFEERVGRVLKISESSKIRYTTTITDSDFEEICSHGCSHHSGNIIAVSGQKLYVFQNPSTGEGCTLYDIESYMDELFNISCVSESTIFIKSAERLKYMMVHIYDWSTDIEYCEIFEQITKVMILPLRRVSDELILTIGAVDGKGRPREQVIRLKIH